jgi:hypothetical protein
VAPVEDPLTAIRQWEGRPSVASAIGDLITFRYDDRVIYTDDDIARYVEEVEHFRALKDMRAYYRSKVLMRARDYRSQQIDGIHSEVSRGDDGLATCMCGLLHNGDLLKARGHREMAPPGAVLDSLIYKPGASFLGLLVACQRCGDEAGQLSYVEAVDALTSHACR